MFCCDIIGKKEEWEYMTIQELQTIYLSRPFKIRNADEYDLENILDLFIDPTEGLNGPFEFANSIIKGKMGSGKTMFLRANYAYYLYTLVPCLLEGNPIILPVYIKLSDFQNTHDAQKIYESIIIKIIEEIVSVCGHLRSANELARLHSGASTLPGVWTSDTTMSQVLNHLKTLTANEYVERITNSFEAKGSVTANFLSAYSNYATNTVRELKMQETPSFQDVVNACSTLLSPFNGKLLLLFDEIGSLSKTFFKSTEDGDSYFETLMNQLRTLPFVRTKLAVYPHSSSDILKETRYGDIIELECDIANNDYQYHSFMEKTVSLIERYIEKSAGNKYKAEDMFELSISDQLLIEQLINASEGNMRRLVHLLDSAMNIGYARSHGNGRVIVEDVLEALKKQGAEMESLYPDVDKDFLDRLARLCRTRSTYRFTFPNKSTYIGKYTNLSAEYNIINIRQAGTGRQGTLYSFDYSYCVYKDIPTHYIKNSERIDKSRSRSSGEPIKRIAQLTDELLFQSGIRGRIEGTVSYLDATASSGFAIDSDGNSYFILASDIIKSDLKKSLRSGGKIIFTPTRLNKETLMGTDIEILS